VRYIGPYQVLDELGRGGMGVVYQAFDPAIGRPVAIKIIQTSAFVLTDEISEAIARLKREAAAAGRLSHPNIVTVYELGEWEDFQYIAMELVPGQSLEELLSHGREFSAPESAEIIQQIAAAVDHAGANGIIHRDIKPGNILVRPDGVIKVADFGIARIESQSITRTGMSLGTPAYMAPEQIKGEKVGVRADQYSLAVVAYRLLGGQLPFVASDDYALFFKILNTDPAPLFEVNPDITVEADRVIRRALNKDPEHRFDTCRDFSAMLDAALNDRKLRRLDPRDQRGNVDRDAASRAVAGKETADNLHHGVSPVTKLPSDTSERIHPDVPPKLGKAPLFWSISLSFTLACVLAAVLIFDGSWVIGNKEDDMAPWMLSWAFCLLGLLPVVFACFTLAKSPFGLNLSQVVCPTCRTIQPRQRKFADEYERFWGGWTCANCGIKMDKWGRPRSAHEPSVLLLILAIFVPAAILFMIFAMIGHL